jgi:endoribonuclease Dicer
MMQKDDTSHLSRYKALKEGEPEANKAYQTRHAEEGQKEDPEEGELDEDDEASPADLAERERYVITSSGAVLTYDNAISLLNYLCALIPRDTFTPQHKLKFTGDFEATLHLPPSMPLSPQHLTFSGPRRGSKREARRAAAFMAVKQLHELDVFDEFLLPTANSKGKGNEDIDGRPVTDVSKIPSMMEVEVVDPWTNGRRLWLHNLYIDDHLVAGLVTGTMLPAVDVLSGEVMVRIEKGKLMHFEDEEDENQKRECMREFTILGIWLRITARPFALPPSLFVIPLIAESLPDYNAIKRLNVNPRGIHDWSSIGEDHYNKLIIMNDNEFGRPHLLRRLRPDLTPRSKPSPGSVESAFPTYHAFFTNKWTRKNWLVRVPFDGPLAETVFLSRSFDGIYSIYPSNGEDHIALTAPKGGLAPQGCLRWFPISHDVSHALEVLPVLCHRVTDIYRAQRAQLALSLPSINTNLLVEALTLPSTNAGYSNQRMETLGDAVLELCTTVHLFNKYPHRHEGQLSVLRQNAISNRYLLARAKEVGLEKFITSETQSVYTWRYVEAVDRSWGPFAQRSALRRYPRRSLQDCMEATLGAAFVTGGIPMALHAGEALGLAFGGTIPWPLRYGRQPTSSPGLALFSGLEERLGYTFHKSELLLEAVTHPSFTHESGGSSYQRLEFLGDGGWCIFGKATRSHLSFISFVGFSGWPLPL